MGYLDQWKAAKSKFEKDTGKKKPSKTFLKIRVGAGLDKAAKAVDAADRTDVNPGRGEAKWGPAHVKNFAKAVAYFRKQADNYAKTLDQSIADEDKDIAGDLRRSLKILKADLDAIASSMEGRTGMAEAASKNLGAAEATAAALVKNTKGAVARALAACQKIKQSPTVATYNSFFPKVARDITQQVGNMDKLRDKYPEYHIPNFNGKTLFNALKAWADDSGGKTSLKTTGDESQDKTLVLQETKSFSQAVKQVRDMFGF